MIRKTLVLMTAAAAVALPSMALAGHDGYQYAKVVDVEPVYRYVSYQVPQRECWTEVEYEPEPRYRHRTSSTLPTIAGGVVGGVVGRQFGSGRGRDAMTVIGTLIGAAVAHDASHRNSVRHAGYTSGRARGYEVERCETRYVTQEDKEIDGYHVTYRYAGREYITRTQEHPGKRIRVRVDVTPAVA